MDSTEDALPGGRELPQEAYDVESGLMFRAGERGEGVH